MLTDKVFKLIEKGLDDSILGWNEAKLTEYHKYIKSQKRVGRKSKRVSKKVESPLINIAPQSADQVSTPVVVEDNAEKRTA